MKFRTMAALVLATALVWTGCDDAGGDGLATTSSALSTSQAFDDCVKGIEDCRVATTDAKEFSEECRGLMECLPEQADEPDDGWREFCLGAEERCALETITEEVCEELRRRCAVGSGEPAMSSEECYAGCMEGGFEEAICDERCVEPFEFDPQECLADCLEGTDFDEDDCGDRCGVEMM